MGLWDWYKRRWFASAELAAGGVYAERYKDGTYRVVKVLVVDGSAYHCRLYANRFDAMPTTDDLADLTLGSLGIDDLGNWTVPSEFGIGHMLFAKAGVDVSKYQLIAMQSVEIDELEGYNYWVSRDD